MHCPVALLCVLCWRVLCVPSVADWREYATSQLSIVPADKKPSFLDAWNMIANQQLGATLAMLPPANNNGQVVVKVPVEEEED